MAELWLPEVHGPEPLCGPCDRGAHHLHEDLIEVRKDGVDFGPMACGCGDLACNADLDDVIAEAEAFLKGSS